MRGKISIKATAFVGQTKPSGGIAGSNHELGPSVAEQICNGPKRRISGPQSTTPQFSRRKLTAKKQSIATIAAGISSFAIMFILAFCLVTWLMSGGTNDETTADPTNVASSNSGDKWEVRNETGTTNPSRQLSPSSDPKNTRGGTANPANSTAKGNASPNSPPSNKAGKTSGKRFDDDYLASLVDFTGGQQRLLGPSYYVDDIPILKFNQPLVRQIAPAPKKTEWSEYPWEPRKLIETRKSISAQTNNDPPTDWRKTLHGQAKVVGAVITKDGSQTVGNAVVESDDENTLISRTSIKPKLAEQWKIPKSFPGRSRPWLAETEARPLMPNQFRISNGFALQVKPRKSDVQTRELGRGGGLPTQSREKLSDVDGSKLTMPGPVQQTKAVTKKHAEPHRDIESRYEYDLEWIRGDSIKGEPLGIVTLEKGLSASAGAGLQDKSLLRADISPNNEMICFTKINPKLSQLTICDKDGNNINTFTPYGNDKSVDHVDWYANNRILTLGDGRLTIWSFPELDVVKEFEGGFRAPVAVFGPHRWTAVAAGDRLDLLDLDSGECLGHFWNPTKGRLCALDISPDGKKIASVYSTQKDGKQGDWFAFDWNLEEQTVTPLPTTDASGEIRTYFRKGHRCRNPSVRWFDNQHLVVLGQQAILVNCELGIIAKIKPKRALVPGGGMEATNFEAISSNQIAKQIEQMNAAEVPGSRPAQVCVALPDPADRKRLAERYAMWLRNQGSTIGPGGDTHFITATTDDKGPELASQTAGQNGIKTPRVIYKITVVSPKGKVVRRVEKIGQFLEGSSKFYTGSKSGKQQFSFVTFYQFPKDYRKSIVDEILEKGAGLLPKGAGMRVRNNEKFEGPNQSVATPYRLQPQPMPRNGIWATE